MLSPYYPKALVISMSEGTSCMPCTLTIVECECECVVQRDTTHTHTHSQLMKTHRTGQTHFSIQHYHTHTHALSTLTQFTVPLIHLCVMSQLCVGDMQGVSQGKNPHTHIHTHQSKAVQYTHTHTHTLHVCIPCNITTNTYTLLHH